MIKNKFWQGLFAITISAISLLMPTTANAKKLTLLYIPLDNRPVCLDYVKQTMEAVDCKIILPPEKFIANKEQSRTKTVKNSRKEVAVMTCEAYLDLISGHIDAANSAREEQLLQEHLKQCPQCRALLSALTENDDVLAALPCTPPKDLTEKIMAQVRTTPQAAAPRSHRRAWVAALSAAAALTVAVFAALPALSNAQKHSARM